jgi:spore germination protein YaaH
VTRLRPTGFRLGALIGALAILTGSTTQASPPKRISGNLVFWDQSRGFDAIRANADLFSEISPFWYTVDLDGRVVPFTTDGGAPYVDPSILSFLRGHGILVIPTVANILDGVWNGALVTHVIGSPTLAAANIANLVQLAVTKGYDGIDLDYENLSASDRPAFTDFVNGLGRALHASGKLLTVNVYAKTSEPGTWSGPQAQDWWAIGQAADQVRIMAYEYHWATSGPGPISPIGWVNDVLGFARSTMAADKVVQGVPLYGYDWVGQSGVDIVWEQADTLAKQSRTTVTWDADSASPWFDYSAKGTRHTVWFENGSSVDARLRANAAYGAGGVTLWRLGGQDPGVWSALRRFR